PLCRSWVGSPAPSTLSLTTVGTPENTPGRGCAARSRARAKSGQATADSSASTRSMRAIAARAASAAETRPAPISAARPTASRSPRASSVKAWLRWAGSGVGVMAARYYADGWVWPVVRTTEHTPPSASFGDRASGGCSYRCQSRSGSEAWPAGVVRGRGRQRPIDLTGDEPFQASHDVFLRQALG